MTGDERKKDERQKLARTWIALQTTPRHAPEYNSLFWSFEQTYDLVREDPVEAWNLVLAIWALDQSPQIRQSLSAGPIEGLLCYHGKFIIPHIERQAKADPSFARLLGAVGQNTMPDNIWNRLQDTWIAPDGSASVDYSKNIPVSEICIESALLEFAKLAALLLCMLSLYIVFRTLFLSIEDPPHPSCSHPRSSPTAFWMRFYSSPCPPPFHSSAPSSSANPNPNRTPRSPPRCLSRSSPGPPASCSLCSFSPASSKNSLISSPRKFTGSSERYFPSVTLSIAACASGPIDRVPLRIRMHPIKTRPLLHPTIGSHQRRSSNPDK